MTQCPHNEKFEAGEDTAFMIRCVLDEGHEGPHLAHLHHAGRLLTEAYNAGKLAAYKGLSAEHYAYGFQDGLKEARKRFRRHIMHVLWPPEDDETDDE